MTPKPGGMAAENSALPLIINKPHFRIYQNINVILKCNNIQNVTAFTLFLDQINACIYNSFLRFRFYV